MKGPVGIFTSKETVAVHLRLLRNTDGINTTAEFLLCMDVQLSAFMARKTGITNFKKLGLAAMVLGLSYGNTSSFITTLYANGKSQTGIRICWKSMSGKLYRFEDEPDCKDLEFWLENVDYDLLIQQLYGASKLPFNPGRLSYELTLGSLSMIDLELRLYPIADVPNQSAVEMMVKLIDSLNMASLSSDRQHGIIHNVSVTEMGNYVRFDFDFGSASFLMLKKLLHGISQSKMVERVVVGHIRN